MLCNEGGDTRRISAVRESILADGSPAKISRAQALGEAPSRVQQRYDHLIDELFSRSPNNKYRPDNKLKPVQTMNCLNRLQSVRIRFPSLQDFPVLYSFNF